LRAIPAQALCLYGGFMAKKIGMSLLVGMAAAYLFSVLNKKVGGLPGLK
jgi:hypothetical protein